MPKNAAQARKIESSTTNITSSASVPAQARFAAADETLLLFQIPPVAGRYWLRLDQRPSGSVDPDGVQCQKSSIRSKSQRQNVDSISFGVMVSIPALTTLHLSSFTTMYLPPNSIDDAPANTSTSTLSPSISSSSTTSAKRSKLWTYLNEEIREDLLLESELLLLTFATGIQDAASWPDYSCFASNQTGNMLFLVIGAAGMTKDSYSISNIGTSLSMFILGALVLGQLGNWIGVRKRLWLLISNVIQTGLVFLALAIQNMVPVKRDGFGAMAVVGLMAFSSGGQVGMARALKITEITTAAATAAIIDVCVDPSLVKIQNRLRNRRILFLILLTAGCFVGIYVQKALGSRIPFLLCGGLKAIVCFGFFFNRPMPQVVVTADLKV